MAYQSHADKPGVSKSEEKLAAIRMPLSLKRKRVLDLGCNEGFFCFEAKRRGAARVVGVDRNDGFISTARERATEAGLDVEFVCGDILSFPEEEFEYVLVLSVLHYIADPQALFARIHNVLAPGGTLILECGVARGADVSLKRALRSIDDRLFPTEGYLHAIWLKDYAVKLVAHSPAQAGDPIPRQVFHCQRAKPNVVFVHSGVGKTNLASQIGGVTIATDEVFSPARNKTYRPSPQDIYDQAKLDRGGSIRKGWDAVREDPVVRAFFTMKIVEAVRLSRAAPMIVVEGYVVGDLYPDIKAELGEEFRCWSTQQA